MKKVNHKNGNNKNNTTKKAWLLVVAGLLDAILCFGGIGVPFAIILTIIMIKFMIKHKSEVWFEGEYDPVSVWTIMVVVMLFDIGMSVLMIGLITGMIEA